MRFLLICIFSIQMLWSKPLPKNAHQNFIIDTDCAIDDMRAISILLSQSQINIVAIIVSEGSLSPSIGAIKIKSLLHTFNKDSIPVLIGASRKGINPPWRKFNEEISWGREIKNEKQKLASEWLIETLTKSNEKITFVCLGALTNEAELIENNSSICSKIEKIIWYNDGVKPLSGFNYECDKEAANKVLSSKIRMDVISNLQKNELVFDTSLFNYCKTSKTAISSLFYNVHKQKEVYSRLTKDHFKMYDELVSIYILNPDLFDVQPLKEQLKVRYNNDYNRFAVKEMISDIISGTYVSEHNIVFNSFPLAKQNYTYDVRQIMDSAIKRYGLDEWKACVMTDEFHGHLGVYSIVGAKMGILAREIFGVETDRLEVTTFTGTKPPYSCMNDGIQVSTGATLGQGTIAISKDSVTKPMAIFSYNGRKITIKLKPKYIQKVDDDIKDGIIKFGLMDDGYWKLVRHSALDYWENWDRKNIFEVIE